MQSITLSLTIDKFQQCLRLMCVYRSVDLVSHQFTAHRLELANSPQTWKLAAKCKRTAALQQLQMQWSRQKAL